MDFEGGCHADGSRFDGLATGQQDLNGRREVRGEHWQPTQEHVGLLSLAGPHKSDDQEECRLKAVNGRVIGVDFLSGTRRIVLAESDG